MLLIVLPVVFGLLLVFVGGWVWIRRPAMTVPLGFEVPVIKKDKLPFGACLLIVGMASFGSPLAFVGYFRKDEFADVTAHLLAHVVDKKPQRYKGKYMCENFDEESFVYLSDSSILDLRGYKKVTSVLSGIRISPATLMNTMVLMKKKDVRWLKMSYGKSSAPTLDALCLDRPAALKVESDTGIHPTEVSLCIDTRDIKVGDSFSVTNLITYWNAFNDPGRWWYETYSNHQDEPETLTTGIIFPEEKPFQDFHLKMSSHVTHATTDVQPTALVASEDKRTIYWTIDAHPRKDEELTYRTEWVWPSED